MLEETKSDGPEKVLATYEMTNRIQLIKEIAADKLIVSDLSGVTSIVWTENLTKVHSLDLGGNKETNKAWSAIIYQNLLFVGASNGIHIFDANQNFKQIE